MIFTTTLFSALTGCIIAFVWAIALQFDIKSSLQFGALIGGAVGLIFGIYQKIIEIQNKRELRDMTRGYGGILFLILVVGVLTGLIAWFLRFVFF